MKKRISLSVSESVAEKLREMSEESDPHLSQSAIGEYALKTVDMSKFIQEENDVEEKLKPAAKKK